MFSGTGSQNSARSDVNLIGRNLAVFHISVPHGSSVLQLKCIPCRALSRPADHEKTDLKNLKGSIRGLIAVFFWNWWVNHKELQ
jgi:hypothetical protein